MRPAPASGEHALVCSWQETPAARSASRTGLSSLGARLDQDLVTVGVPQTVVGSEVKVTVILAMGSLAEG